MKRDKALAAVVLFAIIALSVIGVGAFLGVQAINEQAREAAAMKIDANPPAGQAGHMGYVFDSEESRKFLASLDKPTMWEAAPDLFWQADTADRNNQGVFLYRYLAKAHEKKYGKPFVVGNQGIGDCVSWGWKHGIATATAIDYVKGIITDWDMPATESIYGGARVEGKGLSGDGRSPLGGYSDGAMGANAAKFVTNFGVLMRRKYPFADLTIYSPQRARSWGAYGCGGKGDYGKADEAAREFPVKTVALVEDFDQAKAAIRSGYPVVVCSNIGFARSGRPAPPRDADGFLYELDSWGHCMVFVGVRLDKPGLLCLNSWGPDWVTGPKYPDDQPDGSFWVDEITCNKMLTTKFRAGGREWTQKDSFAVSAVGGFELRQLNNADWLGATDPAETHYAIAP